VLQTGADMHAGAEVAGIEGKAGLTIMGIGVSAKVGGDVASIHGGAGYNININSNAHQASIGVKLDAGFLIGIKGEFNFN